MLRHLAAAALSGLLLLTTLGGAPAGAEAPPAPRAATVTPASEHADEDDNGGPITGPIDPCFGVSPERSTECLLEQEREREKADAKAKKAAKKAVKKAAKKAAKEGRKLTAWDRRNIGNKAEGDALTKRGREQRANSMSIAAVNCTIGADKAVRLSRNRVEFGGSIKCKNKSVGAIRGQAALQWDRRKPLRDRWVYWGKASDWFRAPGFHVYSNVANCTRVREVTGNSNPRLRSFVRGWGSDGTYWEEYSETSHPCKA